MLYQRNDTGHPDAGEGPQHPDECLRRSRDALLRSGDRKTRKECGNDEGTNRNRHRQLAVDRTNVSECKTSARGAFSMN